MARYPKLQDKKWLAEQVENKPLRQIAAEVGCSYSGVLWAVKRFNLVVPHRFTHRFSPTKSESMKKAYKKLYPNGRFGELATGWKGGRHGFQGYIMVYSPDHPRARSRRIFEHILVAEKTLGRYLNPDEVVHHLNGKKDDNRPENLKVVTRADHVNHHMTSGKRIQLLHQRIAELEKLLDKHGIPY